MLILLPPSETKRPGGSRRAVDLAALGFPELTPVRERVVDALAALAADPEASARVLGLGARQQAEATMNAALRTAPAMPAIDRYTGVLFDALGTDTLDGAARAWLGRNVAIHSSAFGLVRALDRLPSYRLGAGITVPAAGTPRKVWGSAITDALEARAPGFVLDRRSEAYVALGPVPASVSSAYVRVTTRTGDGAVRALNHFNKKAKGELVRALAHDRPRVRSTESLISWASASGVDLRAGDVPGQLELRVPA